MDEGLDLSEDDDSIEEDAGHAKAKHRKVQFTELEADEEGGQSESEGEGNTDVSSITRSLSLKRAIHPPFVRLPYVFRPSDPSQSSHSHVPWTANLSADIELNEDDILPSNIDESELVQELEADDELDARDHEQEVANEARLWRIFEPPPEEAELVVAQAGTKRKHGTDDDDVDEDDIAPRKKRRKRHVNMETCEPHGRIKSAPYIEDSD